MDTKSCKILKLIDDIDRRNNKVISFCANGNVCAIEVISTQDPDTFDREAENEADADTYTIEESVECSHDNLRRFCKEVLQELDSLETSNL